MVSKRLASGARYEVQVVQCSQYHVTMQFAKSRERSSLQSESRERGRGPSAARAAASGTLALLSLCAHRLEEVEQRYAYKHRLESQDRDYREHTLLLRLPLSKTTSSRSPPSTAAPLPSPLVSAHASASSATLVTNAVVARTQRTRWSFAQRVRMTVSCAGRTGVPVWVEGSDE